MSAACLLRWRVAAASCAPISAGRARIAACSAVARQRLPQAQGASRRGYVGGPSRPCQQDVGEDGGSAIGAGSGSAADRLLSWQPDVGDVPPPPPTAFTSSWKGVTRFYSHVSVAPAQAPAAAAALPALPSGGSAAGLAWYQVIIDGRPLRTNGMRELLLPSHGLALAIAAEFAAQGETVLPACTPLYNLACTAIDTFVHEDVAAAEDLEATARASRLAVWDRALARSGGGGGNAASPAAVMAAADSALAASTAAADAHAAASAPAGSQPAPDASAAASPSALAPLTGRHASGAMTASAGGGTAASGTSKLRDLLLDYLETDTVCYRLDVDMADPAEKVLRKRQDKYYGPIIAWFDTGYATRLGTALGFGDLVHPADAYVAAEHAADSAHPFVKAALQQLVGSLKSAVLTLAVVHRAVDVDAALTAARLEEEWQIGENGFVEDGHDTARAALRVAVSSAAAYLALLPRAYLPPPPAAVTPAARRAAVGVRRARETALVAVKRRALLARELGGRRSAAAAFSAGTPSPSLEQ
jgi:chaperone required for assembly of F1-ATPase